MMVSGLALVWAGASFSCKVANEGSELTVTYSAATTVVSSTSAGGMGGTPATSGMGGMGGAGTVVQSSSVVGSTAMSSSAMSSSSTGMFAEMPVNDCCSGKNPNCPGGTKAMDLTDTAKYGTTITIVHSGSAKSGAAGYSNPNFTVTFPLCMKIKVSQTIVLQTDTTKGGAMIEGGQFDNDLQSYAYDTASPIQPRCYNGPNDFASLSPSANPVCWNTTNWPCGRAPASIGACQNANQNTWNAGSLGYGFFNIADPTGQHGAVYIVP